MFLKYFRFGTLKKVKELKDWIYKAGENQSKITFFRVLPGQETHMLRTCPQDFFANGDMTLNPAFQENSLPILQGWVAHRPVCSWSVLHGAKLGEK